MSYTSFWNRANILNVIHKSYEHCSTNIMFDIIRTKQWWSDMKKNIKEFVRSCSKYQLTVKSRDIKRDEMHSSETWSDKNQPFEKWDLNLIKSLLKTDDDNKWIITAIDYNIKWSMIKAISKATAKTLADFIINDMYKDYGTFKEIIINKNVNLWTSIMNMTFELIKIKYRSTISYHSRTNETVKRFNNTLNQMLIKYCIKQLIKNWNKYFNQILFVTRIRTHTIIDFSSFYLLYNVNSRLPNDAAEPTLDLYNEKINSAFFLNKNKAEAFKKIMQQTNENKIAWNAKVKNEVFASDEMILIRTKKFKKFEVDWYKPYEVVRKKILNIYVLKFFESSFNKYLINDDRMKLIYINETISKDWRMFKGRKRSRKHTLSKNDENKIKKKRERSRKQTESHSNVEYKFVSKDNLEEDANQTI